MRDYELKVDFRKKTRDFREFGVQVFFTQRNAQFYSDIPGEKSDKDEY